MRGGAFGSRPTNFSRTVRAASLFPAGRGGCGAGRIPAELRAAGGGGAASVPVRRDPDVPAAAVAARTAGTAAALRPDVLRTLRTQEGTGPGTLGPVPDPRTTPLPAPVSPRRVKGPLQGSKWVTPWVTRTSKLARPGFRLSRAQHPSPRPQPRRIRSRLYAFTPVEPSSVSVPPASASLTLLLPKSTHKTHRELKWNARARVTWTHKHEPHYR